MLGVQGPWRGGLPTSANSPRLFFWCPLTCQRHFVVCSCRDYCDYRTEDVTEGKQKCFPTDCHYVCLSVLQKRWSYCISAISSLHEFTCQSSVYFENACGENSVEANVVFHHDHLNNPTASKLHLSRWFVTCGYS